MTGIVLLVSPNADTVCLEVIQFSGTDGIARCAPDTDLSSILGVTVACSIQAPGNTQPVWSGAVRLEVQTKGQYHFTLQVRSQAGEVLEWKELPSVFTIADGGYEALAPDRVGTLLDDLIQFPDVSRSMFFSFASSTETRAVACKVKMEDISSTDAILVEFDSPSVELQSASSTPAVVSVELFEITYLLVGFIEAIEGPTGIFVLSGHVYRDQRQIGRRYLNPPVAVSLGEFTEVSDFGAKLRCDTATAVEFGSILPVDLPNLGTVQLRVIHKSESHDDQTVLGCMVENDAKSTTLWINFLLSLQYPLLRFRRPDDYGSFWKLLSTTGYTTPEFTELNSLIRAQAEAEWQIVDSNPDLGGTVVAYENETAVGTIGVTRVGSCAWTAQVAAMSNKPDHLPQTRSLYAWRTRFILQRPDGGFHVAFFQRDKPFLDRFFRKFLLQHPKDAQNFITWEEWRLYTHALPYPNTEPSASASDRQNDSEGPSALFRVLAGAGPHAATPRFYRHDEAHILVGRPFQHLCQYFTSAWFETLKDPNTLTAISNHLGTQQVYTVRTKDELDLSNQALSSTGRTIDDGWDVVWVCHRALLLSFMANSLRALELMYRKYGSRSVA